MVRPAGTPRRQVEGTPIQFETIRRTRPPVRRGRNRLRSNRTRVSNAPVTEVIRDRAVSRRIYQNMHIVRTDNNIEHNSMVLRILLGPRHRMHLEETGRTRHIPPPSHYRQPRRNVKPKGIFTNAQYRRSHPPTEGPSNNRAGGAAEPQPGPSRVHAGDGNSSMRSMVPQRQDGGYWRPDLNIESSSSGEESATISEHRPTSDVESGSSQQDGNTLKRTNGMMRPHAKKRRTEILISDGQPTENDALTNATGDELGGSQQDGNTLGSSNVVMRPHAKRRRSKILIPGGQPTENNAHTNATGVEPEPGSSKQDGNTLRISNVVKRQHAKRRRSKILIPGGQPTENNARTNATGVDSGGSQQDGNTLSSSSSVLGPHAKRRRSEILISDGQPTENHAHTNVTGNEHGHSHQDGNTLGGSSFVMQPHAKRRSEVLITGGQPTENNAHTNATGVEPEPGSSQQVGNTLSSSSSVLGLHAKRRRSEILISGGQPTENNARTNATGVEPEPGSSHQVGNTLGSGNVVMRPHVKRRRSEILSSGGQPTEIHAVTYATGVEPEPGSSQQDGNTLGSGNVVMRLHAKRRRSEILISGGQPTENHAVTNATGVEPEPGSSQQDWNTLGSSNVVMRPHAKRRRSEILISGGQPTENNAHTNATGVEPEPGSSHQDRNKLRSSSFVLGPHAERKRSEILISGGQPTENHAHTNGTGVEPEHSQQDGNALGSSNVVIGPHAERIPTVILISDGKPTENHALLYGPEVEPGSSHQDGNTPRISKGELRAQAERRRAMRLWNKTTPESSSSGSIETDADRRGDKCCWFIPISEKSSDKASNASDEFPASSDSDTGHAIYCRPLSSDSDIDFSTLRRCDSSESDHFSVLNRLTEVPNRGPVRGEPDITVRRRYRPSGTRPRSRSRSSDTTGVDQLSGRLSLGNISEISAESICISGERIGPPLEDRVQDLQKAHRIQMWINNSTTVSELLKALPGTREAESTTTPVESKKNIEANWKRSPTSLTHTELQAQGSSQQHTQQVELQATSGQEELPSTSALMRNMPIRVVGENDGDMNAAVYNTKADLKRKRQIEGKDEAGGDEEEGGGGGKRRRI